MLYDRLYKKTSTGAVQVWWMEQEAGRYRTHSGKLDGKIVVSAWTQCGGKNTGRSNATTAEQQARAEVESKYTKRQKEGYATTIEGAMASTLFKPMLAKEYPDYIDRVFSEGKAWSQPKLNGIRCIAKASGLFTRKAEPIVSMPHVSRALSPVFKEYPDMIVDGELFNPSLDLPTIQGLVSKKTDLTSRFFSDVEELIQYHMFDVVDSSTVGDYPVRSEALVGIAAVCDHVLKAVPTHLVRTHDQIDQCYRSYLQQRYEGQMIRRPGLYQNKRTDLLLKRKEFVDAEFVVVDIDEGKGNSSGTARRAYLKLDTDPNRIFKADIKGSDSQRAMYLKNKHKLIGGVATVQIFSERSPDGIPMFGKVLVFHGKTRQY